MCTHRRADLPQGGEPLAAKIAECRHQRFDHLLVASRLDRPPAAPSLEQLGNPPHPRGDNGQRAGNRLLDDQRRSFSQARQDQQVGTAHLLGDLRGCEHPTEPQPGRNWIGHFQRAAADHRQAAIETALDGDRHRLEEPVEPLGPQQFADKENPQRRRGRRFLPAVEDGVDANRQDLDPLPVEGGDRRDAIGQLRTRCDDPIGT
ncbi:MAG TPA: hypothetical protein EYN79_00655 [Planctomycetes bacterium]|nr:hypothetical protein [Planctomycetota bacterium]